jgi:F-type H+-transporting ATPase subunit delta
VTNRAAAARYARALFDVVRHESSGRQTELEKVQQDLSEFARLLEGHSGLSRALANPAIPGSRKRAVIEQLVGRVPGLSRTVAKLLLLMADRDRLVLLPEVVAAYRERLMDHLQVVRAEVTTAIPLPPDRVQALQQGLARATGRQVQLGTRVDASIIGGAIARIGSTVYDGSVTTQLVRLKQKLVEAEA